MQPTPDLNHTPTPPTAAAPGASIMVWDPLVRLFHWALVALILTEYLSGEAGAEPVHFIAGYLLIPLLVVRLLWGFIGSHYARFANFLYPWATTRAYLFTILRGHPPRYLGHNPAGAVMVYLLLTLVLLTLATGLLVQATIEFEGPLLELMYQADDAQAALFRRLHGLCVNGLLLLVPAHILGVIVASYQHREKLILSMITGKKNLEG